MKTSKIFLPLLAAVFLTLPSCGDNGKKAADIKSEADLHGHTITTGAGSYYDNKYSGIEGVEAFLVNTEADAIQALKKGFADVFIIDEVMFTDEMLKDLGMRKAFIGEESFPCAMAFQKGDGEILPLFNEFLSEIKADGTLEAIINYWLHGGEPVPYKEREIIDPAPIRAITSITVAPISYLTQDGWTGLDPDIIKRFGKWAGRKVEISDTPISSAIMALQTDRADIVCGCLFPTEERRTHMDFSSPYYQCHPGFFMLDGGGEAAAGQGFFSRAGKALRDTFFVDKRWKLITDGLLVTLEITLLSILFGTILAALYCAMARGRRRWMRSVAGAYDFLMQGIPVLVLLLIMFYVVLADTGLPALWVAVVTFALNFASSAGNVFASSIGSIPRGQWEAGSALGFTQSQTFRLIIFPQALKNIIGPYQGHCISLLKGSSIVGYIAVQDLTRASDLLRSRTFEAFMPLLAITVIYFVLAWLIRLLLNLATRSK